MTASLVSACLFFVGSILFVIGTGINLWVVWHG